MKRTSKTFWVFESVRLIYSLDLWTKHCSNCSPCGVACLLVVGWCWFALIRLDVSMGVCVCVCVSVWCLGEVKKKQKTILLLIKVNMYLWNMKYLAQLVYIHKKNSANSFLNIFIFKCSIEMFFIQFVFTDKYIQYVCVGTVHGNSTERFTGSHRIPVCIFVINIFNIPL